MIFFLKTQAIFKSSYYNQGRLRYALQIFVILKACSEGEVSTYG
jgi:hypothetical protein